MVKISKVVNIMNDVFFSDSYLLGIKSAVNRIRESGYSSHFSFPFIPSIDTRSDIAVVGLEPKKWVSTISEIKCIDIDVDSLIKSSMQEHLKYKPMAKGNGFSYLMRLTEKIYGQKPEWLNFFAFSYNRNTISKMRSKNKKDKSMLMNFSAKKLIEELGILSPKVIIFSGSYYGKFKVIQDALASDRKVIKSGMYCIEKWGEILIIRVPHPSSRVKNRSKITINNLNEGFDIYKSMYM